MSVVAAYEVVTMIRGKFALAAFLLITLLSCGGGKQSSVVGGQPSDSRVAPPLLSGGQAFKAATPSETTLDEALAELDALPVPTGVDASVFAKLKAALGRELRTRNAGRGTSKLVSMPPDGAANKVNDLTVRLDGQDYLLQWSYRNCGDYNQDGIVNIQDITPLAVHFNEEATDSNEVIDGNADTVVNIQDITPLAAHFFCDLARYSIQTSPSQTGTFAEIDTAPFSVALAEGSRRLRFSVLLPQSASGFIRVVPMDSIDNPGIPSNVVPVPVLTPPQPPACIQATDGYYPDKVEVTWAAPASGPTPQRATTSTVLTARTAPTT